ncbi:MerR family transcriptional regulator [Rhodococcus rhodnii]|uniref:MerR family transcriptional regulator n=1 Tax=Rhodococcus rhodnii LMG 5362 TaxID=1273125 RepID=R7WUA0_9NOCA|nr:MerR family transcriptional regulator [Rhodococcus rhodnii]EOM77739.1 MerR family transcriptional regulator [Rhodococcus rhodnii LMG 5362]
MSSVANSHARTRLFGFSDAVSMSGVGPQTLRLFERRGLISPVHTLDGRVHYTESDVGRIGRIDELAARGLNLAGIDLVLELEDRIAQLETQLTDDSEPDC